MIVTAASGSWIEGNLDRQRQDAPVGRGLQQLRVEDRALELFADRLDHRRVAVPERCDEAGAVFAGSPATCEHRAVSGEAGGFRDQDRAQRPIETGAGGTEPD